MAGKTDVPTAMAAVLEKIRPGGSETVPLAEAAGRILARDVAAERDIPAFDRATMDGIAVASSDLESGVSRFEIMAVQAAGEAPAALGGAGQCVRIMTGAVCPAGADTVIPVERLNLNGGFATVDASAKVRSGQFVHRRASDRAGGAIVLAAGMRLAAPEIAVLASVGCADVPVASLPRIAVVSTGNELVDVGDSIEPWQIRSSNDRAVEALLGQRALARVNRETLRDDEASLLERIEALHAGNDVLILSGGVSMGDFDFVPAVLERLGAQVVFHRVEQKPGRPFWFGVSRDNRPIFALPGNPVSTLVCARRYVVPALERMLGMQDTRRIEVVMAEPVRGLDDMTWFLPVRLAWRDGRARAEPRPTNTSGDFSTLATTDGFVELPARRGNYEAGEAVEFFRW